MKRRRVFKVVAVLLPLVLVAVGAEVFLRAKGTYATWLEKNGGAYASPYGWRPETPWVFVNEPGAKYTQTQPEFGYEVQNNREGLRDRDHPLEKPAGEYRICALGDSFTFGQGAAFEDTWPQALERTLAAKGARVRVLTGGVCGSDPVFGYQLLRTRLARYSPDLVLLAVNGSDVYDLVTRGGLDRFEADGRMKPAPAPAVEALFRRSHVVRALMLGPLGYDWHLLRPAGRKEKVAWALDELAKTAVATRDLGKEKGWETLVVIHPFGYQVDGSEAVDELAPLRALLQERGVRFVDLFPYLRERIPKGRIDDFFWPVDRHCKKTGYALMADGIARALPDVPGFPR